MATIVQAGPFFGDRPSVAGFVRNVTVVTRSLFLEYVHVDVDGSVVDGLGNGNDCGGLDSMRHLCLYHVALAKAFLCVRGLDWIGLDWL